MFPCTIKQIINILIIIKTETSFAIKTIFFDNLMNLTVIFGFELTSIPTKMGETETMAKHFIAPHTRYGVRRKRTNYLVGDTEY